MFEGQEEHFKGQQEHFIKGALGERPALLDTNSKQREE